MLPKKTNSIALIVAGAALGAAVYASRYQRNDITAERASEAIKRFAEDQKVEVELSEDQMEAIQHQWEIGDPSQPAEITFTVRDRPVAGLKVASYSYRGDTCCA